ncbi:MAG: PP-loop domain-containing protein [Desulfobulbaceae bacterium]|nr:PP-loop domain-containing protein [Desulfobulbaceae bacterium]
MHAYDMLADGDRVLIAVSGGVDSLVLAWVLHHWRRKAPIVYDAAAIHVDMAPKDGSPGTTALQVVSLLDQLHINVQVVSAARQPPADSRQAEPSGVCFQCARARRNQLFEFARRHDFTKVALGHHRDDLIETFFLNFTCAGNISTMVPKQELFSGRLTLIRPLAYLEKSEIETIADRLDVKPVPSQCPLSEKSRRRDIHQLLEKVYEKIPGAKEHMFSALTNVRHDYLLKPLIGKQHANKS